jgi:hypothetical protein
VRRARDQIDWLDDFFFDEATEDLGALLLTG